MYKDKDRATLKSGDLSVCINRSGDWQVDFLHDEKRITGSGFKSAGYAIDDPIMKRICMSDWI